MSFGDWLRNFFSQKRNPELEQLESFARERKGVEGYIEPRTATQPTTLLLVDRDGDSARAPVREPEDASRFLRARRHPGLRRSGDRLPPTDGRLRAGPPVGIPRRRRDLADLERRLTEQRSRDPRPLAAPDRFGPLSWGDAVSRLLGYYARPPRGREAMISWLSEDYGNPSSVHGSGVRPGRRSRTLASGWRLPSGPVRPRSSSREAGPRPTTSPSRGAASRQASSGTANHRHHDLVRAPRSARLVRVARGQGFETTVLPVARERRRRSGRGGGRGQAVDDPRVDHDGEQRGRDGPADRPRSCGP